MALSNKPQDISENAWFYEETKGLHVIAYSDRQPADVVIPWEKVRASLARKDKRKAPRAKAATRSRR